VSVALLHYMCFVVVAHHVPHTTVPANRPHRPVSAPPKMSPRAETGQPVRTPYGARGRRLARRLHPCAPAARPPFEGRPKWSSALKARGFQKCPVPPRGTSGTSTTFLRKGCPEREEGPVNGSSDASRPGDGGPWMALDTEPKPGSAHLQPITGRTGKQADRQAGRLSGMQPIGGSSSGSSPDEGLTSSCFRISNADRLQRRYAACHLCRHADRQTVTRAGRQTATTAGRPKECSDAAPQHFGCGNP
jgi:hypothetical protein